MKNWGTKPLLMLLFYDPCAGNTYLNHRLNFDCHDGNFAFSYVFSKTYSSEHKIFIDLGLVESSPCILILFEEIQSNKSWKGSNRKGESQDIRLEGDLKNHVIQTFMAKTSKMLWWWLTGIPNVSNYNIKQEGRKSDGEQGWNYVWRWYFGCYDISFKGHSAVGEMQNIF